MHLIEEDDARRAYGAACLKWKNADRAWDTITYVVLHDQYAGTPLSESGGIRALSLEGARSIDMPTLTIVYERRGDTTIIHNAVFKNASSYKHGNG